MRNIATEDAIFMLAFADIVLTAANLTEMHVCRKKLLRRLRRLVLRLMSTRCSAWDTYFLPGSTTETLRNSKGEQFKYIVMTDSNLKPEKGRLDCFWYEAPTS